MSWNRFTMPLKPTNRSIGAKDGSATQRTQQEDKSNKKTRSGGGEARALSSGLRIGLQGGRQRGRWGNEKCGVPEREQGVRTAARRRGSQGAPEVVHLVWEVSGKRGKRKAKSLVSGVEIETSESDMI